MCGGELPSEIFFFLTFSPSVSRWLVLCESLAQGRVWGRVWGRAVREGAGNAEGSGVDAPGWLRALLHRGLGVQGSAEGQKHLWGFSLKARARAELKPSPRAGGVSPALPWAEFWPKRVPDERQESEPRGGRGWGRLGLIPPLSSLPKSRLTPAQAPRLPSARPSCCARVIIFFFFPLVSFLIRRIKTIKTLKS